MPPTFSPLEAELAYRILGLAFALFVWIMAFSEWQRTHNRDYYVIGLAFTIMVIRQLFPYLFFAIEAFGSEPVSRSFSILVNHAWENLAFAIMAGVVLIRMARSHLRFEKLLIAYFGFVFLLALELILIDRMLPFWDLDIWTPFVFTMLNLIILSFAIASCYTLRDSVNHFFRKAFWVFYIHQLTLFYFLINRSESILKGLTSTLPIIGALFIVLAVHTSIRNEIESKTNRLKQLDAMKSRFLAVVSHELRTPLSSMKISYDLLLSGKLGEVTPKQNDAISIIKSNSDRLIRMIEELLDVSRIERGAFRLNLAKQDLVECLRNIIKQAETNLIKRSGELEAKLPQKPILMWFDADKIPQVVINLLHNADRYNREGGTIQFHISEDPDFVKFDVVDQGPGIPPEKISTIFESFVRAESGIGGHSGLGLGLHIAKQIVEAHGGSIGVSKTGKQGTRIRFTLSKHLEPEEPDDAAPVKTSSDAK